MHSQNTPRPWREVAAEVTNELDSSRLLTLMQELNQALEEQGYAKTDGEIPQKETH